jgi:transcriptional regulator with XRE-family HTH domain
MAETMLQYVIRRAGEVKQYHKVAKESGIGPRAAEWLAKIPQGRITNPSYKRIEKLCRYYKLLEAKELRQPR